MTRENNIYLFNIMIYKFLYYQLYSITNVFIYIYYYIRAAKERARERKARKRGRKHTLPLQFRCVSKRWGGGG